MKRTRWVCPSSPTSLRHFRVLLPGFQGHPSRWEQGTDHSILKNKPIIIHPMIHPMTHPMTIGQDTYFIPGGLLEFPPSIERGDAEQACLAV